MVPTRRTALRLLGTAGVATLAGCTELSGRTPRERYTLRVDRIEGSLAAYALDDPTEDELFAETKRAAVDAILPEGRYTTYGFEPLTEGSYLRHEGRYYRTVVVVTGERTMPRHLVGVSRVEDVPDPVPVDSLPRASARVFKILHGHAVSGGASSAAEHLRGDHYVLRRPSELSGPIPTGLDGDAVALDPDGDLAYRVSVTEAELHEPAYTTLAVRVADSPVGFRAVVFGDLVDRRLGPRELAGGPQGILEEAIARGGYEETAPLSPAFEELLETLDLSRHGAGAVGNLLYYAGDAYRYGLVIDEAS